jgi:hypothetical protein
MISRTTILVAIVGLVGAVLTGWWLFGWSTGDHSVFGKSEAKRWFGRYTVVRYDSDRNGSFDWEARWRWPNEPVSINAACGDPGWIVIREDRDLDGRWDTWTRRPNLSKPCELVIEADTTGDGVPNLKVTTGFAQLRAELKAVDEIRGFPIRPEPWESTDH